LRNIHEQSLITDRMAGANNKLPQAGVRCFVEQESASQTFVLRSKVRAEKPRLRQFAKR